MWGEHIRPIPTGNYALEYKNSLWFSVTKNTFVFCPANLIKNTFLSTEMASGITCRVRARCTVIHTFAHGSCPTLLQYISTGSTTEALTWLTVPRELTFLHTHIFFPVIVALKPSGFSALLRHMLTVVTKSVQPHCQPLPAQVSLQTGKLSVTSWILEPPGYALPQFIYLFIFQSMLAH